MLPIDRYLSGWMTGFLTGIIITGLILAITFLIFEIKRRRTYTTRMRSF